MESTHRYLEAFGVTVHCPCPFKTKRTNMRCRTPRTLSKDTIHQLNQEVDVALTSKNIDNLLPAIESCLRLLACRNHCMGDVSKEAKAFAFQLLRETNSTAHDAPQASLTTTSRLMLALPEVATPPPADGVPSMTTIHSLSPSTLLNSSASNALKRKQRDDDENNNIELSQRQRFTHHADNVAHLVLSTNHLALFANLLYDVLMGDTDRARDHAIIYGEELWKIFVTQIQPLLPPTGKGFADKNAPTVPDPIFTTTVEEVRDNSSEWLYDSSTYNHFPGACNSPSIFRRDEHACDSFNDKTCQNDECPSSSVLLAATTQNVDSNNNLGATTDDEGYLELDLDLEFLEANFQPPPQASRVEEREASVPDFMTTWNLMNSPPW